MYQYASPTDSLDIRFIVPSLPAAAPGSTPLTTASVTVTPWVGIAGQIDFAVAYATDNSGSPIPVILTNQDQAQVVYTVNQPNPIIWDSLFEQAFVATLGVYLVPALSLQMELMKVQITVAERAIAQARIRDGDEGDTIMDHLPDWMSARNSGALYNYGQLGNGCQNYYNPVWPTG